MYKRQITLLFISFFIASFTYSQESNFYSIHGQVKLSVGLETTIPINAMVMIKSANKYAMTDSLGSFRFDSLAVGAYRMLVQGFGYNKIDTLITITDSNKSLDLLLFADCEINKVTAQSDIKENKPRLLIIGGIVPTIYPDQHLFESKYGVKYDDYGDTPPPQECVEQYNREIFEYLDKKFGKSWRKEVRKDVVGLKNKNETLTKCKFHCGFNAANLLSNSQQKHCSLTGKQPEIRNANLHKPLDHIRYVI